MIVATAPLPVCNALWIGQTLGPTERACLLSFAEAGHRVDLYVYEELADVPHGVNVVDAATLLPRDKIIRHTSTGSYSLFSNRFRYALMKAGLGLWIDCDLLCLKPVLDSPFTFGRQDDRLINGAILKLPHDHPVLDDLIEPFETRKWIPPWTRLHHWVRHWIRHRLDAEFGIQDMAWGTSGPAALTYFLGRHGLAGKAQPPDVFYPIGWREVAMLVSPDQAPLIARITAQTLCIHLWHHSLNSRDVTAEPGSFLAAIIDGSWRNVLASVRHE